MMPEQQSLVLYIVVVSGSKNGSRLPKTPPEVEHSLVISTCHPLKYVMYTLIVIAFNCMGNLKDYKRLNDFLWFFVSSGGR